VSSTVATHGCMDSLSLSLFRPPPPLPLSLSIWRPKCYAGIQLVNQSENSTYSLRFLRGFCSLGKSRVNWSPVPLYTGIVFIHCAGVHSKRGKISDTLLSSFTRKYTVFCKYNNSTLLVILCCFRAQWDGKPISYLSDYFLYKLVEGKQCGSFATWGKIKSSYISEQILMRMLLYS